MTKWIKKLSELSKKIPENFKPIIRKKKNGEKELGKISAELIKMYKLIKWLEDRQFETSIKNALMCPNGEKRIKALCQLSTDKKEIDAVKNLFWMSVRYELKLSPNNHIGIREGGIVVNVFIKEENGPMVTFLAKPEMSFSLARFIVGTDDEPVY